MLTFKDVEDAIDTFVGEKALIYGLKNLKI